MLQYLLNATLIWAACLAVYELLFKRETWHQWNRAYLLLALMTGLLLPAFSFGNWLSGTGNQRISQGVEKLIDMKRSITAVPIMPGPATAETMPSPGTGVVLNASGIMMGLYLAGVLIALLLLIRDVIKVRSDYKNGTREQRGHYHIVWCNRPVAPYSFFNFIFISKAHNYSEKELDMVFQHEYRHIVLRHSADMLFICLLQTLCWFHPLIYLFKTRLQLIHEYQADEVGLDDHTTYGTFLLEQAVLSTHTLSLTHSFHASLKNRIIMLTKKTSAKKQLAKYLVAIPMAAVFMIACTRTDNTLRSVSVKEKQGNMITRNGHRFEMTPEETQVATFTSVGGQDTGTATFTVLPYPVKMDGEMIRRVDDEIVVGKRPGDQQPMFKGGHLGEYLVKANQSLFDQLPDGNYHIHINNLVLDKSGNLVFNDPVALTQGASEGQQQASPSLLQTISQKTNEALENSPGFKPGIIGGNPVVAYYFPSEATPSNIVVKDHQAQFLTEIDPQTFADYAVIAE